MLNFWGPWKKLLKLKRNCLFILRKVENWLCRLKIAICYYLGCPRQVVPYLGLELLQKGILGLARLFLEKKGFTFTLEEQDQIKVPLEISLWGKHNVINALGPIIIARGFGPFFFGIQKWAATGNFTYRSFVFKK